MPHSQVAVYPPRYLVSTAAEEAWSYAPHHPDLSPFLSLSFSLVFFTYHQFSHSQTFDANVNNTARDRELRPPRHEERDTRVRATDDHERRQNYLQPPSASYRRDSLRPPFVALYPLFSRVQHSRSRKRIKENHQFIWSEVSCCFGYLWEGRARFASRKRMVDRRCLII